METSLPKSQVTTAPDPVLVVKNSGVTRPQGPVLQQIAQLLAIAALAFASYLLISRLLVQSVTVRGGSMRPTLTDSESYLLNRWVFWFRSPRRAEIVVLRDPVDHGYSVKRVVGVCGDTVLIKAGRLYLNGAQLEEPFLAPGTPTFSTWPLKEQSFMCGKGEYFVLGDNRNSSVDSRVYGPVPKRNILGLIIR